MLEKYSRLDYIDDKISKLELEISELKAERANLIREINDEEATILNQLPARAKNSLVKHGIDSDWKLKLFLSGNSTYIDPHMAGFNENRYSSASNSITRLMSLPNIGEGTALETMQLLEEKLFF